MNVAAPLIATGSQPTAIDYAVYHSPAVFNVEQETIFRGETWCYLGLEAELTNSGDFRSTFVGNTPVVVVRAADETIHAWVNRCAHKGATVCRSLRRISGRFRSCRAFA
jgi:anthranilate 1,2-dioxygenase large subunit